MNHEEGTDNGEVLVAILRDPADFQIAREQHWYRIPVATVHKRLLKRLPPTWIAFYHPKAFGDSAYGIHYYARVKDARQVMRESLFPDETPGPKAGTMYYRLGLGELKRLPHSIPSARRRRIVFIPTTWEKLMDAAEINDLYDDSPIEDLLYKELKRAGIPAERQEYVEAHGREYCLDFAVYCQRGELNIETDGDMWHANARQAPLDNLRDNDIETLGWRLLRFNGAQVREQMTAYCIPTITRAINTLGGIAQAGDALPRKFRMDDGTPCQTDLFEELG